MAVGGGVAEGGGVAVGYCKTGVAVGTAVVGIGVGVGNGVAVAVGIGVTVWMGTAVETSVGVAAGSPPHAANSRARPTTSQNEYRDKYKNKILTETGGRVPDLAA